MEFNLKQTMEETIRPLLAQRSTPNIQNTPQPPGRELGGGVPMINCHGSVVGGRL